MEAKTISGWFFASKKSGALTRCSRSSGGLGDVDGLDLRAALERDALVAGDERGLDVAEAGAEGRDLHVLDGELERRVVRIGGVRAG